MTDNVTHTDVAAYALGSLSPDDRAAFEAHLASCPTCTAELAEFSGMAELLVEARPAPPTSPSAPAPVVDLLRKRGDSQRRRSRRLIAGAIAAAVVLFAAGGAVGIVGTSLFDQEPTPAEQIVAMGDTFNARDVTTNVSGTVGLATMKWGTDVALSLENVHGPIAQCRLVAVAKDGSRETVTNWRVPAWGYGTSKAPEPLFIEGGTSTKRSDLDRLVVEDLSTGRELVSINV